jgi:hypothetical protein
MSEIDDGDIYDMGHMSPLQGSMSASLNSLPQPSHFRCVGSNWYCWPCMDAYMKSAQDEAKK